MEMAYNFAILRYSNLAYTHIYTIYFQIAAAAAAEADKRAGERTSKRASKQTGRQAASDYVRLLPFRFTNAIHHTSSDITIRNVI